MLTKTKTTSLRGRSMIDNVEVARFDATIAVSEGQQTSLSTYIEDQMVYRKNLKQVRADGDAFRDYVREEEDKQYAELEESAAETESEPTKVTE